MGRRTFESLGKPLPNRVNLVLTRNPVKLKSDPAFEQLYKSAKLTTASTSELSKHHTGQLGLSIPEATETSLLLMSSMEVVEQYLVDGEAWVIGGATIYQQLLPRCSDLYLTHVKRTVEGETLFPEFLNDFEFKENIAETSEFRIVHYVNRYPGRTHFTPS